MSRKIQMLAHISGYRPGGQPWPMPGEPLVAEDWEAEHLIRGQMARDWPYEEPPSPEPPAPQEPAPQEPAPAEGGAYGYAATTVQHYAPVVEVPVSAPKPVAPKADWVAWAVANGADEHEASASTKADLMEQYGDRA